jgi:hypothetical protein
MVIFSRIPSPHVLPEPDDGRATTPEALRKALAARKFNIRWENKTEFTQWMNRQRQDNNYAFVCNTRKPTPSTTYIHYVCHRAAAGGSSKRHHAKPKHEPQPGKRGAASRPAQHVDCPVVLNVREFSGSEVMLGNLEGEHNHKLAGHNVEYEQIAPATWERMKSMIRQGMTPEAIVRDHSIYSVIISQCDQGCHVRGR